MVVATIILNCISTLLCLFDKRVGLDLIVWRVVVFNECVSRAHDCVADDGVVFRRYG